MKIFLTIILFLSMFNIQSQTTSDYKVYDLQKDTLRVLSWNIKMLPGIYLNKHNKQKIARRSKAISKEILKKKYDIIVFQEAFNFNSRRIIKKNLADKYPYIYKPLNYKLFSLKGNGGVWVLSKIPLKNTKEVKYKKCSSTDCLARKGAILMEGVNKNINFQIIGTHLQSGSNWQVRQKQYHQLAEILEKNKRNNILQIICGDMNCAMQDKNEYQNMINILQAKNTNKNQGLKYSNYNKNKIIDYILTRDNNSNLLVKSKIILIGEDWDVKKHNFPKKMGLSDHLSLESIIIF